MIFTTLRTSGFFLTSTRCIRRLWLDSGCCGILVEAQNGNPLRKNSNSQCRNFILTSPCLFWGQFLIALRFQHNLCHKGREWEDQHPSVGTIPLKSHILFWKLCWPVMFLPVIEFWICFTSRERNSSMLTASGLLRAASNLRQTQLISFNLLSKKNGTRFWTLKCGSRWNWVLL